MEGSNTENDCFHKSTYSFEDTTTEQLQHNGDKRMVDLYTKEELDMILWGHDNEQY